MSMALPDYFLNEYKCTAETFCGESRCTYSWPFIYKDSSPKLVLACLLNEFGYDTTFYRRYPASFDY
jgi:hypothetical protein